MNIYVACCHDRHIDPVVRVFLDLGEAVIWVNDWMDAHVAAPDLLQEEQTDFAYWLSYGDEEDHAFIAEVEMPAGLGVDTETSKV